MSETELHIGKLVPVKKLTENETTDQVIKRILDEEKIDYSDSEESLIDILKEDQFDKYFMYNGILYESKDKEYDANDAYCAMTKNEDGSIDYVTSFYNGGTCFSEMIADELETLK